MSLPGLHCQSLLLQATQLTRPPPSCACSTPQVRETTGVMLKNLLATGQDVMLNIKQGTANFKINITPFLTDIDETFSMVDGAELEEVMQMCSPSPAGSEPVRKVSFSEADEVIVDKEDNPPSAEADGGFKVKVKFEGESKAINLEQSAPRTSARARRPPVAHVADPAPAAATMNENTVKKRGGQLGQQRGPYKKKPKTFIDLTVATSSAHAKVQNDKLIGKSTCSPGTSCPLP